MQCKLCQLVLFVPLLAAQPGPSNVPCLDTMVINTQDVFVAQVAEICGVVKCASGSNVVLSIENSMKGEIRGSGKMQYRIDAAPADIAAWQSHSSRLLLVGERAIDLSDPGLKVLTADMQVLTGPEPVLRAARKAIDSHRNVYGIVTFVRMVPPDEAQAVGHDINVVTAVPADSDLENWALSVLHSNRAAERAEAARALGYFPSAANAESLKTLLDDPALTSSGDFYFVRNYAYLSLQRMGVNVPEPKLQK